MFRHWIIGLSVLCLLMASGCQRQRGQNWNWLAAFGSPRISAPANGTYQIQGTAATSTPPGNSYYNPNGSNLQAQPASSSGGVPTSPASFRQQSPGWQPQGNGNQSVPQNFPANDRTSQQNAPNSVPPVTMASNSDTSRLQLNDASNIQVPSSFQGNGDFHRFGSISTQQSMGNSINVGNRGSIEISGNANVVGAPQNRYASDPYRNNNQYSYGAIQNTQPVRPMNTNGAPSTHSNVLATSTTNVVNPTVNNSGWQSSNSFQR